MLQVRDATFHDIPLIQDLAEKIWWPAYTPILPADQIRFMLSVIYSTETLKQVMQDGSQKFILLESEQRAEGFASYGKRTEDPAIYKLHKLYVLPGNQGKGYGRMLLEDVKKRVSLSGIRALDLNVNRYNPAKTFYEKIGFRVIREEDVPIGPYWMNDYVMRLEL